ncbi:MAG: DUF2378 family protein [Deltaproteobacteria bacterium]|nr:DUF2378 family protein [Deltaproteobacteria bacterium]
MSPTPPSERDPVLGDARFASIYARQRVKGSLLAARGRYVREEYGEDTLARIAKLVSPQARQHLDNAPLPFAWYPLEYLIEIDRQILLGPMHSDFAQMKLFGDRIARYDLNTIYKVLFRLGSPAFVLKRIGIVYSMYLKGGRARSEVLGKGEARVTFEDTAYPYYLCAYGMSGWLSASVSLSGGQDIRVEHERCVHSGDEACRWHVSWT